MISIKTIQEPKSKEDFHDLYVVYELMETDLATIIKSPQKLTDEHCQFFLYQILRGMKYIHSAHILHRDLVPLVSRFNKPLPIETEEPFSEYEL